MHRQLRRHARHGGRCRRASPRTPPRAAAAAPQYDPRQLQLRRPRPNRHRLRRASPLRRRRKPRRAATCRARSAAPPTRSDAALPRNSELQMPQVRSLPEPDDPRPAPPPPRLPRTAAGAVCAAAARRARQRGPASSRPPYRNSPRSHRRRPRQRRLSRKPSRRARPASRPSRCSMLPTPDQLDPAQITLVAARYKERLESTPPLRAVRVIAYTAPPAPRRRPARRLPRRARTRPGNREGADRGRHPREDDPDRGQAGRRPARRGAGRDPIPAVRTDLSPRCSQP